MQINKLVEESGSNSEQKTELSSSLELSQNPKILIKIVSYLEPSQMCRL